MLLTVYKSLHGLAPSYLSDLIVPYTPSRPLRSSSKLQVTVPETQGKYGDRAFATAGPVLWNRLPLRLRQVPHVNTFKTELKTYLFECAFGQ